MNTSAHNPENAAISWPRELLFGALLTAGFAAFMIWDQFHWWGAREDYSFGYLVPLFVAYVLYDRWPVIRSYFIHGAPPGKEVVDEDGWRKFAGFLNGAALIGFVVGLVLFGIGALLRSVTGPQNPASLAIAAGFAGLLLSGVFILSKERIDGREVPVKNRLALTFVFLFPALIWLLSAPMVSVLETNIRVFLLNKVTMVVFTVFDVLGYELERQGNVLILPEGRVGVEEACSGIRSLTACLFAGSFLAAVFLDRFWKKVLLVAAAMCLAVFANLLRSLFLTLLAYHNGSGALDESWVVPVFGDLGSAHDVTGFAILGVTCVGLLLLLPIFNFRLKPMDDEDEGDLVTGNG